jgi:hypothetical protein
MPALDPDVLASIQHIPAVASPAQPAVQVGGLDSDVMASIRDVPAPAAPQLDSETLSAIKQTDDAVASRQQYLRDKYAVGLVNPLSSVREKSSYEAIRDLADSPTDRQMLIQEVGNLAKMQDTAYRNAYNEAGYADRLGDNTKRLIGQPVLNASYGIKQAVQKLRDNVQGNGLTAEQSAFARQLEAAQSGQSVPGGVAGQALSGAAGIAPDVVAGTYIGGLAGAFGKAANIAGQLGYWTARTQPERTEDYQALGLSPKAAVVAGTASAAMEALPWMLDRDPTGLTQGIAAPLKGFIQKTVAGIAKPLVQDAVSAGLEAAVHTGLGAARTGLQSIVREEGKALAGSGETQGDILGGAVGEAVSAVPSLAVMGAVGLPKSFAEAKQARIQTEVIASAASGETPTRSQWKSWGLPVEDGMSIKDRQEAVGKLAESFKTLEQIQSVLSGAAPTDDQWKRWGLPAEEGKTTEQRQAFLKEKFAPPEAAPAPGTEAAAPEEKPSAVPQDKTLATEQSDTQQPTANDQASLTEGEQPPPAKRSFMKAVPGTHEDIPSLLDSMQAEKKKVGQKPRWVGYQKVSEEEAGRLKDATGLDLEGYRHIVDEDGVLHALKEHGVDSEKRPSSEPPITMDDIAKVQEIVNDGIPELSSNPTKGRGLPVVVYRKRINGHIVYVEEVRTGGRKLAFHTMYKVPAEKEGHLDPAWNSTPEAPRPQGPVFAAEGQDAHGIIGQAGQEVKSPVDPQAVQESDANPGTHASIATDAQLKQPSRDNPPGTWQEAQKNAPPPSKVKAALSDIGTEATKRKAIR